MQSHLDIFRYLLTHPLKLIYNHIGIVISKINGTLKGVYLLISKLHSILAVANLLAFNKCMVMLVCASKFATTKIECSFEMGK